MKARSQPGFTLVELLVVIAIIAMLVSLLLSAVQQVREAARKTQCISHHRQCALGLLNWSSANGERLPGTYRHRLDSPGFAIRTRKGRWRRRNAQWTYQILPFIEEQPLMDQLKQVDWWVQPTISAMPATPSDSILKMFQCPSADRYPHSTIVASVSPGVDGGIFQGRVELVQYGTGEVIFDRVGGTDICGVGIGHVTEEDEDGRVVANPRFVSMWGHTSSRRVGFKSVLDGLSKTAMLGENTQLGKIQPYLAAPLTTEVYTQEYAQIRNPHVESVAGIVHGFKSPHTTFALAFGDGSVRSVDHGIDRNILIAAISRNGGDIADWTK